MAQVLLRGDFYCNFQSVWNDRGYNRVLCVTSKNVLELSGAKTFLDKLLIDYQVYHNFSPNPKSEDIYPGINVLKSFNPNIVLAIGGGSAMDMAKLIVAFADQYSTKNTKSFESYLQGAKIHSLSKLPFKPLWVAPTTSGSGAEATHFAVVYHNNKKYSLASDILLPSKIFLDYTFTKSVPKNIFISAAIDALCQAIESYWALEATEQSRQDAVKAMELIIYHFDNAVLGEDNALEQLQYGAYLAGKAINISKTTAGHAFSYYLTQKYNVLHGNAVAICLSYVVEYSLKYGNNNVISKLQKIADILKLQFCDIPNFLIYLLKKHQLMDSLESIGIITEQDVSLWLKSVNVERLNNNPFKIDINQLQVIVKNKKNKSK